VSPRRDQSNISPPRKNNTRRSQKDLSPPRRKQQSEKELSPPRRKQSQSSDKVSSPPRKNQSESSPPRKPDETKKDEVKRSGLMSAEDIQRQHADRLKNAKDTRTSLDPVAAGKGAETIYRDKKGRPLTMLNKLINSNTKVEEEEYEWGGGKKDREAEEQKNFLKSKKKENLIVVLR